MIAHYPYIFFIALINNTINNTGNAKAINPINKETINGATTLNRENIDNRKNMIIIPAKAATAINIFFKFPPPSQGDYTISRRCLQIFSFLVY